MTSSIRRTSYIRFTWKAGNRFICAGVPACCRRAGLVSSRRHAQSALPNTRPLSALHHPDRHHGAHPAVLLRRLDCDSPGATARDPNQHGNSHLHSRSPDRHRRPQRHADHHRDAHDHAHTVHPTIGHGQHDADRQPHPDGDSHRFSDCNRDIDGIAHRHAATHGYADTHNRAAERNTDFLKTAFFIAELGCRKTRGRKSNRAVEPVRGRCRGRAR
jgi:hypothetical protein